MVVVSDATPLRHLIAIGEAELLPKLYGTVTVPGVVWAELQAETTHESSVSGSLQTCDDRVARHTFVLGDLEIRCLAGSEVSRIM
jgi:hypothetical protein